MTSATFASGALISRPSLAQLFLGWLSSFGTPAQDAADGDYAIYRSMCRGL